MNEGLTQRVYRYGSSGAPWIVKGPKQMLLSKFSWSGKVINERIKTELVKLCCWHFPLINLCGFLVLATYR